MATHILDAFLVTFGLDTKEFEEGEHDIDFLIRLCELMFGLIRKKPEAVVYPPWPTPN